MAANTSNMPVHQAGGEAPHRLFEVVRQNIMSVVAAAAAAVENGVARGRWRRGTWSVRTVTHCQLN